MKYIGEIYGRVAGKYIPLKQTSADVDAMDTELAALRAQLERQRALIRRCRKVLRHLSEYQRIFERLAHEPGYMPGNDFYSDWAMKIVNKARAALAQIESEEVGR